MTVRVATVLSARDWEPQLVAYAHETASVRIVLRAFQPSDIESSSSDIDVVVAGGEVSWVTPRKIMTWKRLGLGVVCIHPTGDRPAAEAMMAGGADEVLPDSIDVSALVQAIRFVTPRDAVTARGRGGTVTGVVGPPGAPGCTEVALSLAVERSRSTAAALIDLDLRAPAVAVRLGLAPRPDIADAADAVRVNGDLDDVALQMFGDLAVITGSHREGQPGISPMMISGVIDAARARFADVTLDMGSAESDTTLVDELDRVVLVVDASAVGIVRAAQVTSRWMGPVPEIVLNRVQPRDARSAIDAVRTWTGLEPAALVPDHRKVREATLSARSPDRRIRRALHGVGIA